MLRKQKTEFHFADFFLIRFYDGISSVYITRLPFIYPFSTKMQYSVLLLLSLRFPLLSRNRYYVILGKQNIVMHRHRVHNPID